VNVAGYWMIKNVYWNPAAAGFNMLNGFLSVIMLMLGLLIVISAFKKWAQLWKSPKFVLTQSTS